MGMQSVMDDLFAFHYITRESQKVSFYLLTMNISDHIFPQFLFWLTMQLFERLAQQKEPRGQK